MSVIRAQQLLSFGRNQEAEQELRMTLADDPEDDMAHQLLAICLSQQKRIKEAHEEADIAIGLDPENDLHYFAKARVHMADKRYKAAESFLVQALEIDPDDVDYYTGIAHCRMARDDFHGALEFSQQAITIDPEDEAAVDNHIIILNRLGKKEEAQALLEGSLHSNPHNDVAHANQGWAELHNNNPRQARVHFLEALRLDPDNDYARSGLIEALKAGNPIYRLFLLYVLWMGRLSPTVRWVIIIGGYGVFRLANRASYAWPDYEYLFNPFIYVYFAFALMTWMADPLFNLLLFFHPIGRHALNRIEWQACLIASIFLGSAAVCTGLYFAGYHAITLLAAFFCAMMVPHVHSAFEVEHERHKPIYIAYCALLCIAGISGLYLIYQENALGAQIWVYTFYAWIAYMFLGMLFTTERV